MLKANNVPAAPTAKTGSCIASLFSDTGPIPAAGGLATRPVGRGVCCPPDTKVGIPVGVADALLVGVANAVLVGVADAVLVGVADAVLVGVADAVPVGVGVAVPVGVADA